VLVFRCVGIHCNTLKQIETKCNTLKQIETHCIQTQHNTLQHTTTHCDTIHHTATRCNTLQHTATRCNLLQHAITRLNKILLNSGSYIQVTLVDFTTVQMKEIEPRRSNPAVFPKIRNICYVVVAISIMEIATTTLQKELVMSNWKMTLSGNSSFQDPDLLFPTPSTNLVRELRESPQSPQERCATVRTSCAQRQEINFECEFAISSCYQNVEETEI